MSASSLSVAAASSSLCNKISILNFAQIPIRLPSLKPKSLKPLKLKAQNPTSLHFSLLSFSHFRCSSATFDSYEVTEDSQDDPEPESEVEEAVEEEEEVPKLAASGEDGRLYVGNLPYSMTSTQLAEVFGEAGTVISAEVCVLPFFLLRTDSD